MFATEEWHSVSCTGIGYLPGFQKNIIYLRKLVVIESQLCCFQSHCCTKLDTRFDWTILGQLEVKIVTSRSTNMEIGPMVIKIGPIAHFSWNFLMSISSTNSLLWSCQLLVLLSHSGILGYIPWTRLCWHDQLAEMQGVSAPQQTACPPPIFCWL